MWALSKLRKSSALKELSLEDGGSPFSFNSHPNKGILYSMSENGVLQHFSKVIFVSSTEDKYVPTYSARVQVSSKAESDIAHGPQVIAMAANLLSQVETSHFYRLSLENLSSSILHAHQLATQTSATAHTIHSNGSSSSMNHNNHHGRQSGINNNNNSNSSSSNNNPSHHYGLGRKPSSLNLHLNMHMNMNMNINVDSLIGRSAHICYLENPWVCLQLVYSLFPFFVTG